MLHYPIVAYTANSEGKAELVPSSALPSEFVKGRAEAQLNKVLENIMAMSRLRFRYASCSGPLCAFTLAPPACDISAGPRADNEKCHGQITLKRLLQVL